mmetsp:Transcript_22338/g.36963  ORF Transcript_22338/g.36963 Transcript_22338/m.36963 type:complete len:91 (+) Transcript_22338:152-424(+)
MDCDAIFAADEIDAGDPSVPFPPPKELLPFYQMNGMIELKADQKLENIYFGGTYCIPQCLDRGESRGADREIGGWYTSWLIRARHHQHGA